MPMVHGVSSGPPLPPRVGGFAIPRRASNADR
jgi:hypothetical protein